MIDAIAETEIPFFYVIGNHDLDLNVRSNEHARTTYKSYYGPTYYSFNRGNVHYVVLDDIFFIAKAICMLVILPNNNSSGWNRI